MHQQRQDAKTDGLAEHTDREERKVLRKPPGMRRATEGPPAIDLEVPQVGDQKRNGGEDVIPADVEVGHGEVQEDAVLVRPQLVADDDDQQIDNDAGRTDDAETEQQAPVVRMADEDEVSKSLNDRTSIQTQPSPEAAVLLAREENSGALGRADECDRSDAEDELSTERADSSMCVQPGRLASWTSVGRAVHERLPGDGRAAAGAGLALPAVHRQCPIEVSA
jgi:hypothetical protein